MRKLLVLRFGPLGAPDEARIDAAGLAELDRWLERVLTAGSVGDVLR